MLLLPVISLVLNFLLAQCAASRVLVLYDDPFVRASHSTYFADLISRGYEVSIKAASDRSLKLRDWDEWLYDKIIIFAPSVIGESPCSRSSFAS